MIRPIAALTGVVSALVLGCNNTSQPVPLPQLPPKLFPVNFDSKEFPGDPFQAEGKVPAEVTPADNKPRPPGRWLHTMVTVKDNVLVYGGVSNSESLLNDVWVYNTVSGDFYQPVEQQPSFTPRGTHAQTSKWPNQP